MGADGTPLKVIESGKFSLRLASIEFCCQAIVANIKADVKLGLDFLKSSGCTVDVSQTKIFIQVEEHKLQLRGYIGCFGVSLSEAISILPKNEVVCPGKLIKPAGTSVTVPLLIDPSHGFQCSGRTLVARSLIAPGENVMIHQMMCHFVDDGRKTKVVISNCNTIIRRKRNSAGMP